MPVSQGNISQVDPWTRRKFGLATGGLVASLLTVAGRGASAAKPGQRGAQIAKAPFDEVDDSGAGGFTVLRQLKKEEGTAILILATGLEPGTEYVSLYYDNDTCELEPYSEDDVIGEYVANAAGIGHTRGEADDDLDEIGSVSVRLAADFSLVACATL